MEIIQYIKFLDLEIPVYQTDDSNSVIWRARNPDKNYQGYAFLNYETGKITYPEDAIIPEQTPKDREIIPISIFSTDKFDGEKMNKLIEYLKNDHERRNPNLFGKVKEKEPEPSKEYLQKINKLREKAKTNNQDFYDLFMKYYKKEHKLCPKCGHDRYSTTLMGYVFNHNKPHEYKDLNNCICTKCNDMHTYHSRTPQKENTPKVKVKKDSIDPKILKRCNEKQ